MTVDRERVLSVLREKQAEIEERYGLRMIGIIGSVARGDATPKSDVDVIVDVIRARSVIVQGIRCRGGIERRNRRRFACGVRVSRSAATDHARPYGTRARLDLMREDDRDHLLDMLDQAALDEQVAGDRDRFSALCYAVQTIGEAANQVSKEGRSTLADIPWSQVIGMRHRLVHGYRTVVPEIVVSTVRDSIPPLVASLKRALEDSL